MTLESETPIKLGYKMPAEWSRHEGTWLSWPKDPTTFPQNIIQNVESIYVKMVDALSKGEKVNILVNDGETKRIRSLVHDNSNIIFHQIKSVDVWTRDYAPIFVKSENSTAATKWIFNAWGNKYDDLKADNETGYGIAKKTGLRIFEPGIVLEGGSIDTNGLGTLLTTRQCLLNKNRNPKLSTSEIETYLRNYLSQTNIIWLNSGISGDDTDGHVDDIARFVNERTVVCMITEDRQDENYSALKENYEILKGARDQEERPLNVIPISMPKRRVESEGERLPASYANFYIGNSVVLVPTYNDENDSKALSAIKTFFQDREVLGIDSEALVFGFGSIHCVTQQEPSRTFF
ncbi:MAG: agmatine deiminase family protein [Nitrososphaerales archaeon]